MPKEIEIWYDKPNETDEDYSWASKSLQLRKKPRKAMDYAPYPAVLALMEYARPDVVLTANGKPFLVLELTQMNPSGHNLPQRFSCLVRAAELGVPSVYYYLEAARRSKSDPNPRYVNIRVPLGQLRLSSIYSKPSVSIIWPTDPTTNLAAVGAAHHQHLADYVDRACVLALEGLDLALDEPLVLDQMAVMNALVARYYGSSYGSNDSYNSKVPAGQCASDELAGFRVSPPESCQLVETNALLREEFRRIRNAAVPSNKKIAQLRSREFSLVYTGTANKHRDGPEHPYPGYLTLLDILYARAPKGMVQRERKFNLVFKLPIDLKVFKDKVIDRQTGLNILMEFSDLVLLNDGVVVGGYLRNVSAGAVLVSA